MKDKNKCRLSRWCKWFERGNNIAFLHSISLALIFLPKLIGWKVIHSRFNLEEIEDDIVKSFETKI